MDQLPRPTGVAGRATPLSLIGRFFSILAGFGTIIAIYAFFQSNPPFNLTGAWTMTNTIEATSYRPYQGLQLDYRIFIQQNGQEITGTGEKWAEGGRELPFGAHTPITLSGHISGTRVTGTFEEQGAKRKSAGSFSWKYKLGTHTLAGGFQSTAANASGPSVAVRAGP